MTTVPHKGPDGGIITSSGFLMRDWLFRTSCPLTYWLSIAVPHKNVIQVNKSLSKAYGRLGIGARRVVSPLLRKSNHKTLKL